MSYAMIFAAALALSGHCAGMCGAFPLVLRAGGGGFRRTAAVQALYHTGRISTYVFLGVVAAAAGVRFDSIRAPLGIASGALLLLVGLTTLLPAPVPPRALRWLSGSPVCSVLGDLLRDPRPLAAFSVGIFNGFIPCGLVYAAALHAATLGSPSAAALAMLCFGLGTVPALLLVGMAGGLLPERLRGAVAWRRVTWIAGSACLALGILTIARAFASGPHAHDLMAARLP